MLLVAQRTVGTAATARVADPRFRHHRRAGAGGSPPVIPVVAPGRARLGCERPGLHTVRLDPPAGHSGDGFGAGVTLGVADDPPAAPPPILILGAPAATRVYR